MIEIRPSPTADSRTCDHTKVTRQDLYNASLSHIGDVNNALWFFSQLVLQAGARHDTDKLTDIAGFHRDFAKGFPDGDTPWWDAHRKLNRHHLNMADGVPEDVNLIDVLDYIADCVCAGMARSGSVYEVVIDPEVLHRAFVNTIKRLKEEVVVVDA